jgi:hypothetical protein
MKITLTLDYWNGTLSKSKVMDAEDITSHKIIFALLESGVAGITITKVDNLFKVIEHLNKGEYHENRKKSK